MKGFLTIVLLVIVLQVTLCTVRKNYLKCGEQLNSGEWLESENRYYAVVQSNCNFVIYASQYFKSRNALWSSKTARKDCNNPKLVNQKDGNVVLYSGSKSI